MTPETDPHQTPPSRPIVSVELQHETDISTGKTETRMFVKMYFEARNSGLLAALGDRRWRTLCCLATYMDENGHCYPSQATLAKALGVSRQMANQRIQELARFRFHGRPVLSLAKSRGERGRWGRNSYRVHAVSGLHFGAGNAAPPPREASESRKLDTATSPTVSTPTDKEALDINKNQRSNKNTRGRVSREHSTKKAAELIQAFHRLCGHPDSRQPLAKEIGQAEALLRRQGEVFAAHVVSFAVRAGKDTNFDMQHFGAVLAYEAEAVTDFESTEKRRRGAAKQMARSELERRYAELREHEVTRLRSVTPGEVIANLEGECRKRHEEGHPRLPIGEGILRIVVDDALLQRSGFPTSEEWSEAEQELVKSRGVAKPAP